MGTDDDARDLRLLTTASVTHVINCAIELDSYHPESFDYLRLNLHDPDSSFQHAIKPAINFIAANPAAVISMFKKLPTLRFIKLPDGQVRDVDLETLQKLKRLEWLELYKTTVTDQCMGTVSGIRSLRILDIREAAISDRSVERISHVTNLKLLLVNGSRLTLAGLAEIQKELPHCIIRTEP